MYKQQNCTWLICHNGLFKELNVQFFFRTVEINVYNFTIIYNMLKSLLEMTIFREDSKVNCALDPVR